MRLRHDHFRSHVLERTAERMPRRVVTLLCFLGHSAVVLHAPAKVAYLQSIFVADKQILRLDVPMDEAVFVEKVDPGDRLDKIVECFVLVELLVIPDDKKEVPLWYVLKYEVYKSVVFERGITPHNVYVLQLFLDLDLSAERLSHLG